MADQHFVYRGKAFPDPDLSLQHYQPDWFHLEVELESTVFFELRKKNGVRPYRLKDSSPEELRGIQAFFQLNSHNFFFLFEGEQLVGSILIRENYIQCLAIAPSYQRKGYGRRLTAFAVNRILAQGYDSVHLDVMEGNTAALKLYERLGFSFDTTGDLI